MTSWCRNGVCKYKIFARKDKEIFFEKDVT